MKEQLWLNWTNQGMNLILTCLGPLDLTFLAETDLTEQKETTEQTEIIGQLNDEDIDSFITENRNRIEANCKITIFFCSGTINLLFNGLAYDMSGHFAHCSYFSSPLRAEKNTTQVTKYPHILYFKPLNKVYIFHDDLLLGVRLAPL